MKYSNKNIEALITKINDSNFVGECRIYENSFIRNRKMTPKDIILYELNKKGLTTKMEILNFNDINNVQDISSPGLFKQREKLNPNAFIYLMQNSLKLFYIDYEKEVKTYKGYVLAGVDGSDFEIPNTITARNNYNGKLQKHCARATISTCYDLLNHYTLDVIVEKYNYNEFYINDKLIYSQNNQACYLERIQYLTIIDNKYIRLRCSCGSDKACYHTAAVILAIRKKLKLNSFYKVKLIKNDEDETLLDKITNSSYFLCFGITEDRLLIVSELGVIFEEPICNKEGKVQFEVYEDDDEMSLSKVLEGYKK